MPAHANSQFNPAPISTATRPGIFSVLELKETLGQSVWVT